MSSESSFDMNAPQCESILIYICMAVIGLSVRVCFPLCHHITGAMRIAQQFFLAPLNPCRGVLKLYVLREERGSARFVRMNDIYRYCGEYRYRRINNSLGFTTIMKHAC